MDAHAGGGTAAGRDAERATLAAGSGGSSEPGVGERGSWQQGPVLAVVVTLGLDSRTTLRYAERQQAKLRAWFSPPAP